MFKRDICTAFNLYSAFRCSFSFLIIISSSSIASTQRREGLVWQKGEYITLLLLLQHKERLGLTYACSCGGIFEFLCFADGVKAQ
jgi:hypothetical protein